MSKNLSISTLALLCALPMAACCGDDSASGASATDGDYGDSASASASWTAGATTSATTNASAGSSGDSSASASDGGSMSASDGDASSGEPDTTGAPDTTTGEPDTTTTGDPACDAETPVTLYLSPDDSNSMSSPVQAREAALDGFGSLAAVALRPWEFFNYYTFPYPPAPEGAVVVTAELYQLDGAPAGEYVLQIAVTSEALTNEARAPMNVTLVLDESGSMSGTPMDLLKESCLAIASSLKAGDLVSMVGWDTQNAIKLAGYKVSGPNDATLVAAIDGLAAGGGTDLHGGLVAGYDLAEGSFDPARINRIVLISDGGANAGITDIEIIADGAGSQDMDGVYMVGVGVGTASTYNDALMDRVTDVGKGASVFIGDAAEAKKIFGTNFVNTMAVAARDVQVRLDLPPGFEIVTFSGEEYSGDPAEIEPQHLAPNDTMVFHQTIRTCAPELIDEATSLTVTARYKHAISFEVAEVDTTVTFGQLLAEPSALARKGAAVMAYTEALKAIRAWAPDKVERIAEFHARADEALALLPGDAELAEMKSVIAVF